MLDILRETGSRFLLPVKNIKILNKNFIELIEESILHLSVAHT